MMSLKGGHIGYPGTEQVEVDSKTLHSALSQEIKFIFRVSRISSPHIHNLKLNQVKKTPPVLCLIASEQVAVGFYSMNTQR